MARRRTSTERPAIVLYRNDLRIGDNLALASAAGTGRPIVALFVLDEQSVERAPGGAARWWLHHSLQALGESLEERGARLVFRRGPMIHTVAELVRDTKAGDVFFNRRYEPHAAAEDAELRRMLERRNVGAHSFEGALLHDPGELRTGSGQPYKVYTPFWRSLAANLDPRDPADAPRALTSFTGGVTSEALADWQLLPKEDWAREIAASWKPGEAGARERLQTFIEDTLHGYADSRERPDTEGTSCLSPHLAHGEITPVQILAALRSASPSAHDRDIATFRKELGWREFAWHILSHHPDLHAHNIRTEFDGVEWRRDAAALRAWQRGQTGYPIVDAGMRQLWRTGWMHNRVRMIVGSFLVKHLLIDWREGERWFWDTLVDADAANNPFNWQWVAGTGADAAPYFRIFSPLLQGKRFDPEGTYVRRFVPELAKLPDKWIHTPWKASARELEAAGIVLGTTYPTPIVDHDEARKRALSAFGAARRGLSQS